MRVVGTAGHVDHGKSTLVEAVTGMDPDRLAEEKARGMTIDLGFAWVTLPSKEELVFVDVPGHARLLKNMLAGVGAVDACLFVVAATEGWKPQSEEHLRILELLGLRHGLVAITKVGLVDEDRRRRARREIVERIGGTFLEGGEVVEVDPVARIGLDELIAALDRLVETTPPATDVGRPRLWVDRSFSAVGAGTIVTGTLTGGRLAVGDEVVLEPGRPPSYRPIRARIRGLESHRQPRASVPPGQRVAINLTGVGRGEVRRGVSVVRPGQLEPTTMADASLTVLEGLDHPVGRRGDYHFHVGSSEQPIRLRLLGAEAVVPGETGLVRLFLSYPAALVPGDRFVLRELGRSETVGGGEVLDVAPVLPASRARPDRSIDRVVRERGWVEVDLLERLTGSRLEATVGRWVVDPTELSAVEARLSGAIEKAGSVGIELASLGERERAVIGRLSGVTSAGGWVRSEPGAGPDPLEDHPFLRALEARPFDPPDPRSVGIERGELRELVRRKLVVEQDGFWFAASAIEEAGRVVADLLARDRTAQADGASDGDVARNGAGDTAGDGGADTAGETAGVSVSRVRQALGTTRRYVLPLLSALDALGYTYRLGDVRVAGPRLAALVDPGAGRGGTVTGNGREASAAAQEKGGGTVREVLR